MKLGHVLRKERTARGLNRYRAFTIEELAALLGISPAAYEEIESGSSAADRWFPLLCELAVKLELSTSLLITESGKSQDARSGQTGALIRRRREERGHTVEEMAAVVGLPVEEYVAVEAGQSPLETLGPLMLRFAELIEQPVFNIYRPCGVRYDLLDDYP